MSIMCVCVCHRVVSSTLAKDEGEIQNYSQKTYRKETNWDI